MNEGVKIAFENVNPLEAWGKATDWKELFDFYNLPIHNNPPLSMNCRPCYAKVYLWVKKYLHENYVPIDKSE